MFEIYGFTLPKIVILVYSKIYFLWFTLIAMSGIIYVIYDWFITFREKIELLV